MHMGRPVCMHVWRPTAEEAMAHPAAGGGREVDVGPCRMFLARAWIRSGMGGACTEAARRAAAAAVCVKCFSSFGSNSCDVLACMQLSSGCGPQAMAS